MRDLSKKNNYDMVAPSVKGANINILIDDRYPHDFPKRCTTFKHELEKAFERNKNDPGKFSIIPITRDNQKSRQSTYLKRI